MNYDIQPDLRENVVYIGDGLDYLGAAQRASQPFIDVVYLDPPYNTGSPFSYDDKRSPAEWKEFICQRVTGLLQVMKPDGVLFVSIDDSSLIHLRLVLDEVFGAKNFLGIFITKQAMRSNSKHLNTIHEYVVAYAMNKKKLAPFKVRRLDDPATSGLVHSVTDNVATTFKSKGQAAAKEKLSEMIAVYCRDGQNSWLQNYREVDSEGRVFFPKDLSVPGSPSEKYIKEIELRLPKLKTRQWSTDQKFIELHKAGLLHFLAGRPYEKHYLESSYDNVTSVLDFYSRQGSNDLKKFGLGGLFDTPKPVELIKYLIRISTANKNNAVIVDLFAGSGTTAQAVLEINAENNKQHNFHLVQIPAKIKPNSQPYLYCKEHGISPTIDRLTLVRVSTVYKQHKVAGQSLHVVSLPNQTP